MKCYLKLNDKDVDQQAFNPHKYLIINSLLKKQYLPCSLNLTSHPLYTKKT